jgi:hypothetical protein
VEIRKSGLFAEFTYLLTRGGHSQKERGKIGGEWERVQKSVKEHTMKIPYQFFKTDIWVFF